jgi:uncharacterized protein (TIGR03437 family)
MSKWGRILLPVLLASSSIAHAAMTCTLTSAPLPVRSEGLAELMGDVQLACSGGAPGERVMGSLHLLLSAPITNRVQPDGTRDMVLTILHADSTTAQIRYATASTIGVVFNGVDFTLQASGSATFRVSNIRGAVPALDTDTPITASVFFNGTRLDFTQVPVTVGLPGRGFAASVNSILVRCTGSPAPATVSMAGLFAAGTRSLTVRVTDRFPGALQTRQDGADSGTRVLLRYSGIPAGVRLFVPDALAGMDATEPTAGGDLLLPRAAGVYTPGGTGSLLLARVKDAEADGSGGSLVFARPVAATTLNGASEITLVNGAAQVVYEVIDHNVAVLESVEAPSFFALAATGGVIPPPGRVSVVIGPVSSVASATATDPIPRFRDVAPPADCALMDDCASFPTMRIEAPPLEYSTVVGGSSWKQWVYVVNDGGGALVWTASVEYTNGSGWIALNSQDQSVQVTISPAGLAPGVYEATLLIDGGGYAGVKALPVKLTVNPEVVQIDSIRHAATWAEGPSVPGSIVMLKGQRLAGGSVSVTLNGINARLLYESDSQINLVVPAEIAPLEAAQVIVTVDGNQSRPFWAPLAASNPGIFQGGVTNLDGSMNRQLHPAEHGSYLIVYATGLPQTGPITARIGGYEIATPDYAGPAPTLPGVQQVNLRIPDALSWVSTDLVVCGAGVCSPPYQVTVK